MSSNSINETQTLALTQHTERMQKSLTVLTTLVALMSEMSKIVERIVETAVRDVNRVPHQMYPRESIGARLSDSLDELYNQSGLLKKSWRLALAASDARFVCSVLNLTSLETFCCEPTSDVMWTVFMHDCEDLPLNCAVQAIIDDLIIAANTEKYCTFGARDVHEISAVWQRLFAAMERPDTSSRQIYIDIPGGTGVGGLHYFYDKYKARLQKHLATYRSVQTCLDKALVTARALSEGYGVITAEERVNSVAYAFTTSAAVRRLLESSDPFRLAMLDVLATHLPSISTVSYQLKAIMPVIRNEKIAAGLACNLILLYIEQFTVNEGIRVGINRIATAAEFVKIDDESQDRQRWRKLLTAVFMM